MKAFVERIVLQYRTCKSCEEIKIFLNKQSKARRKITFARLRQLHDGVVTFTDDDVAQITYLIHAMENA